MFFGRRRRLTAPLMVLIAVLLASCHLSHSRPAPAGIGQEVLDGDFAFVVTHVDTSPTFNDKHAQGVYLIVSMAVRNVGTEAQFFEWNAQKLKDNTGATYLARFMDPPRIGDVGDSIDPGLQVSVRLAYDVTSASGPTQIVLRDSPKSSGVAVSLKRALSSSPSPGG